MSEEWDKLWKDLQFKWTHPEEWEKQVKAVGDKLIERVEYLEGLTDGDVKLITGLQVENKMIQIKAMSLALQLEAIRNWTLNLRQHGTQVGSIQQVSYANQILEVLGDE